VDFTFQVYVCHPASSIQTARGVIRRKRELFAKPNVINVVENEFEANVFQIMDNYIDIAIIGDYNFNYSSHVATNRAIEDVERMLNVDINVYWVETKVLADHAKDELSRFDGIWVAPGPYANARGVFNAIEYARTAGVPFLGTSGGCQFAILEFTRNVLGVKEATGHLSMEGQSLIQRKTGSSKNIEMVKIFLMNGTRTAKFYIQENAKECASSGLSLHPELLDTMNEYGFSPAALDSEGDVRLFEMKNHDFFVGTLFLPQLTSRGALPHPLITNFVKASAKYREKQFLANEAFVA
jgi:CTP synthase (UTP-ammonia lyase)